MLPSNTRVLVVEDHPDIGMLYERLMPGCKITNANSGSVACDVMKESTFDLVILDMHLGGISGLDVLRFMRQERGDTSTPVLAISADDGMRSAARSIGISQWLSKPIDIDEFYRKIDLLEI